MKNFKIMTQKETIIEVSLQQFLEHGIKKVTVQKLVEPLGLSTKTVYKYFADKEDLLKQCLLVHYAELSKRFIVIEKDLSNQVYGILRIWHEIFKLDFGVSHIFYADLNHYYPQLQDLLIEKFSSRSLTLMKNMIVEGVEEGFFRRDVQADIVLETMGVLYTNITRNSRFKTLNYSPAIVMQNTLDAYIRGICTEKGVAVFDEFQNTKE